MDDDHSHQPATTPLVSSAGPSSSRLLPSWSPVVLPTPVPTYLPTLLRTSSQSCSRRCHRSSTWLSFFSTSFSSRGSCSSSSYSNTNITFSVFSSCMRVVLALASMSVSARM